VSRTIKILILAIVFSFLWGAWWGFFSLNKSRPKIKKGPVVRVLAPSTVFTPAFIEYFEKKQNVQLEVTQKDSDLGLLREALSNNRQYDLIVIHSFIAKSFLIENVFAKIEIKQLSHFDDISVDFKSLGFDQDNRHLLALSWGLNGFLVNAQEVSLDQETLAELFQLKPKVSLLNSPAEIFNLVSKVAPIIKTWVDTGQKESLEDELEKLRPQFSKFAADGRQQLKDKKVTIAQMTNGQAAKLVGEGSFYRYVLPRERATLWLNLVGVSRGAQDLNLAHKVMNQLLDKEMQKKLILTNEQATVLTSLNQDTEIPMLQKAHFIRQVPLSRVELFIHHEALEPTWIEALRKKWPELFAL